MMSKSEIDGFLKTCNDAIVDLMDKLGMDHQMMDDVSKKLRHRLITTLLENDIITAENYSNKSNGENSSNSSSEKREDDILERSNNTIKNLIQQVLDKDNEIKALKAQLEMHNTQQ